MSRNDLILTPILPFRLDLTVWALRRRPDNIVDRWDGQTYRRVLALPQGPVEVAVVQSGARARPRLRVTVSGPRLARGVTGAVRSAVQRLLGLQIDLTGFYRFADRHGKLGPLVRRFQGVKPPRFASVFEGVINGIACQQMTLTLGILLLNRLATRYGAALHTDMGTVYAFPRPDDLADVSPVELRELGFSRQKGRAIVELSRSVRDGALDLERLVELPDSEAVPRLRALRGLGRWTAEYVLLRGLGRTHIFPGDDVGGRNNLQQWLGLDESLDYEGVQQVLAAWKRYGGLIYFHLLLDRLEQAGHLQSRPVAAQVTPPAAPKAQRAPEPSRSAGSGDDLPAAEVNPIASSKRRARR